MELSLQKVLLVPKMILQILSLVTLMVDTAETLNPVRVTCPILTPVTTSTSLPGVVVWSPPVANIPTTPKATLVVLGDPTPPYVPSFMLPLVTRDYLYGIPATMMECLQSPASTFVDNGASSVTLKSIFGVRICLKQP